LSPRAAGGASTPPIGRIGPTVVPLLALAVFINYVDRGNLATAAPLIKDELRLDSTQIGLLISAFFWSYTPGQVISGWLAEKINPYRTLALGLGLWSLATIGSGLVSGFIALFILRVALGLGESAAFPCSAKLLAQHLPTARLGAANGLIGVGLALGPAFGTFAGGLMMAKTGWRPVFLLFGLVSLAWLAPWWRATRHAASRPDATPPGPAPSFRAILAQPSLWGAALGHFASNYSFYFVISWLPLYLVKARGFTIPRMAQLAGLIYVVYAISALSAGWLADRWMRAGASDNLARKTAVLASHIGVAASLLVCAFGDGAVSLSALFFAAASFGFNTSSIFAIGQTLAGPRAAGKWMGVQNGFGNIAGIVGPIITGAVVDLTGGFVWAFVIGAAASLLGVVGWGLMIRKVAPIDWSAKIA
jgi:MFS family permease